jgi:hypothetical protein
MTVRLVHLFPVRQAQSLHRLTSAWTNRRRPTAVVNNQLQWTGPAERSSDSGSVVGAGPANERWSPRGTVTRRRKRIVVAFLVVGSLYVGGLAWGSRRLAWAAIKDLSDRELVTTAPAITVDRGQTSISRSQEAYLLQRLRESPTPTTPRIHVNVRWNALVCARVEAGHHVGPTGAEWKDTLFVCLFGAWVPVYTFSVVTA